MSYCPVDREPCCDDLCRGGGCMRNHGEEMLDKCTVCGKFSNGDTIFCDCDEDYAYPDDAPDWSND